jgi:hypothetical protein
MVSLGSFGVVRAAVADPDPATFDWFGQPVRVTPFEVNQIELVDLMETIQHVDETDPRAVSIVKDLLRQVLHVDDFDQFWSIARTQRQEIEDLMGLYEVLLQEIAARPTRQSSDSAPGRLATSASSPDVSYLPAPAGRPDIQLIHDDNQATRARMAALVG